ncbi:hypothetical protein [Desulfoluna butyratoxydans]|uniref:hypothetical protein n=1 Tax=Desulfoluna butyratoxydans TaxID=231438 RepID=UPI0015D39B9C|nr:hypothetical protein [Desulfoluna butyratoxydans]
MDLVEHLIVRKSESVGFQHLKTTSSSSGARGVSAFWGVVAIAALMNVFFIKVRSRIQAAGTTGFVGGLFLTPAGSGSSERVFPVVRMGGVEKFRSFTTNSNLSPMVAVARWMGCAGPVLL